MRPIDDDFADYVRARQHRLLRAAYLVCGDAQRAEDLIQQALKKPALRRDTVKHGAPDASVHTTSTATPSRRHAPVASTCEPCRPIRMPITPALTRTWATASVTASTSTPPWPA
ncbi:MAG: hypothetical protein ABI692_10770 [Terracoccus sp.]